MKTQDKQFGTVAKKSEEAATYLLQKLATSEEGLSQAEAKKTFKQIRLQRAFRGKDQWFCKFPLLFLGTGSLDDRGDGDPLGGYSPSYRDIEELMKERGVEFDHATVQRWVVDDSHPGS